MPGRQGRSQHHYMHKPATTRSSPKLGAVLATSWKRGLLDAFPRQSQVMCRSVSHCVDLHAHGQPDRTSAQHYPACTSIQAHGMAACCSTPPCNCLTTGLSKHRASLGQLQLHLSLQLFLSARPAHINAQDAPVLLHSELSAHQAAGWLGNSNTPATPTLGGRVWRSLTPVPRGVEPEST